MKKKVALTAAAVALVGTLAVGGTLAWFTDTETATNVVTMGEVDILLTEDGTKTGDLDEGVTKGTGLEYTDIVPGDTLAKKVTIKNLEQPAYVRVKVKLNTNSSAIINTIDNTDLNDDLIIMNDTNEYKFVKEGNDYVATIVCPTALVKDEEWTAFTSVKVPTSWGNEFVRENFNLVVTAEAIQAEHIKSVDEAWGEFDNIATPNLEDTAGKAIYDATTAEAAR